MTNAESIPEKEPAKRSIERAVMDADLYWGIERPRVMGPAVRESSMAQTAFIGEDFSDDVPRSGRTMRYHSDENGWSVTFDEA